MEIFRAIARIKYKDNTFCVLINKKLQKYFIKELEDGSIMYPTEDEYKELIRIFNQKQELTAFFNIGKNYRIVPKVIAKGVAIGALAVVLGVMATPYSLNENEFGEYESTITEEKATLEGVYQKGGYDFHSLDGYEDYRIYRIHKAVGTKSGLRIIECQNFDEFSDFISTKSNPTYTDLIKTLKSNQNVDDKYKAWLLEGIKNLEKSLPDVNLTVLNYNLNRLKLKETTLEALNTDGEKLVGRFDPETGEAYFIDAGDEESNKFVVFHEVLGHGISEATIERDAKDTIKFGEYTDFNIEINRERIVISDSIFIMKVLEQPIAIKQDGENSGGLAENESTEHVEYFYIGQGIEEGKADIIAKMAMGNDKIKGHPYIEQSEQLRIMCEAVGLDFEDYISNGGAEILSQKMQENDVENSLIYIVANDSYVSAMKNGSIEIIDPRDTFKENILAFFKDYADNKIKSGESREEIVKKFSQILARGGDFIHSTFNGEEINYEEFKNILDAQSEELEREE